MKYILPQDHLSYSSLDLWSRDKDAFRRRYYEGIKLPDSIFTLYGREVHQQIDTDPSFADIRLPVSEHRMTVSISGVPILGYIDTYDPETHAFGEYKSGTRKPNGDPRWTQVDVQKHDQLVFYSLLIKEKYGVSINRTYLVWLETEKVKESHVVGGVEIILGEKMKLTGFRKRFERKIYEYNRKRVKRWIISSAKEISQDYAEWKQRNHQ